MDKMNIRDHFPNLNEFCSTDSTKLIKWLKENDITDYSGLNGVDSYNWVGQCPNVEFVIDGYKETFYHTPQFDAFVNYMIFRVIGRTPSSEHHYDTVRKFLKYKGIDKKVRGRIIVWELSHMMLKTRNYDDTENPWDLIRKTIVLHMHTYYKGISE